MAESKEIQALGKISTEVESKITFTSHSIKAQARLIERLRKETERQEEICKFISSGNLRLETEIKNADQQLKSKMKALESIKSANVELKKELLVAKERKIQTFERVKKGKKKYEDLWLQCKSRYESLPYVQEWLEKSKKTESLKETISSLNNEIVSLTKEIEDKKESVLQQDRKTIIDLAQYLARDQPHIIKLLDQKTIQLQSLSEAIDEVSKENDKVKNTRKEQSDCILVKDNNVMVIDDSPNICEDEDSLLMPKLKLVNINLDDLSEKLDQIKKLKSNIANDNKVYSQQVNKLGNTKNPQDVYSSYFKNTGKKDQNERVNNYSKRKLIDFLDDIKLDKNEAFKIVSTVNPKNLQGVDSIMAGFPKKIKKDVQIESEVEEIDLTIKSSQNILTPPIQFSDLSLDKNASSSQHVNVIVHASMEMGPNPINIDIRKVSQEKKVTFDLPVLQEISKVPTQNDIEEGGNEGNETINSQLNDSNEGNETINSQLDDSNEGNETINSQLDDSNEGNETINSQLDDSNVDESFAKIRDMMLKRHNLDISPQFTYTKNTLQTKNNDKIVTSKFFKQNKDKTSNNIDDQITSLNNLDEGVLDKVNNDKPSQMDVEEITNSCVKDTKVSKYNKPVTGLLFNNGPQGIPDFLNVCISTTIDEGDMECPHGIDSGLLLSPTPELPIPLSGENTEVTSQEVPNFLTGLRTTGLSFFGNNPSDNKPANQGNNFTFNFGGSGDNTKGRSGLFSMFR